MTHAHRITPEPRALNALPNNGAAVSVVSGVWLGVPTFNALQMSAHLGGSAVVTVPPTSIVEGRITLITPKGITVCPCKGIGHFVKWSNVRAISSPNIPDEPRE